MRLQPVHRTGWILGGEADLPFRRSIDLNQSAGRVYGELRNQIVYAVLVIFGALLGTHFGLAGVAVAVAGAIAYMFFATGQLALAATETSWRLYGRIQLVPVAIGGVSCGVALLVRLLLEASHHSSALITFAAVGAAAIPGSVGMLWILGDPDCIPLLRAFPRPIVRLIDAFRVATANGART